MPPGDADRCKMGDSLTLEVTTACNGVCRHCFLQDRKIPVRWLTPSMALTIIREGWQTGYRDLHLTGGEPLCWDGLFDLIKEAAGIGYRTILINTNGMLLTPARCRRLAACPGLSLSVSLDGPPQLHDRLRGAGTAEEAHRGIGCALEAGINVMVFTVVSRPLMTELPRFIQYLFRRHENIALATLIQLLAAGRSDLERDRLLLEPEDFIDLVLCTAMLNLAGFPVHIKRNPLAAVVAGMLGITWMAPILPLYRRGSLVVMADGRLGLAHCRPATLGQYVPGAIWRVLHSAPYARALGPDRVRCPRCLYIDRCRSHGMQHPSERDWTLLQAKPYCQAVLEATSGRMSRPAVAPARISPPPARVGG